jgi:uncharacterized protein
MPTLCRAQPDQGAGEVEERVTFHPRGDAGVELEGLLQIPRQGKLAAGLVLCHPDPRYAGAMDSAVVAGLQSGLQKAGYATLRFNLRGVGASKGAFEDGKGEVLDCLGALDFLRARNGVDPARVALVGYSFGSWIGLQACVRDAKVPLCVCVSLPVPATEDITKHPYFAQISFPTLFVTGTEDTISSLATIVKLIDANGVAKYCSIAALQGADHFFRSQRNLDLAVQHAVEFVQEHLPATNPQQTAP